MLRATVLAAPLGALALTAQAAVASTTMQQQFSTRDESGYLLMAQTTPQEAGVPTSPHQEQLLRGQPVGEQQGGPEPAAGPSSTAAQDAGVPSSPHQEQLLRGQQAGEQQGGQQLSTEEGSDVPSSPHQEEVLRGQQGKQ